VHLRRGNKRWDEILLFLWSDAEVRSRGFTRFLKRCFQEYVACLVAMLSAISASAGVDYSFRYFFTERIALRTTLAPSFWIVPVDNFRAGLWVYFGLSYYLKTKERVLVPVE
jgi:hypothetical protein